MNRRRMIACAGAAALALCLPASHAQEPPAASDAVILITLDGARHEEIFGGLDLDILKSTLKKDQRPRTRPTYKRYWAATPDERRRKLLPFFWRLVTEQGSIAGNPALGSDARLSNKQWFSYPGYAEILLGPGVRRPDHVERSDPQPVRDRARAAPARAEADARRRSRRSPAGTSSTPSPSTPRAPRRSTPATSRWTSRAPMPRS